MTQRKTSHWLKELLNLIFFRDSIDFSTWDVIPGAERQGKVSADSQLGLEAGLIPVTFKIFNFKPEMSFLNENSKNDNYFE